MAIKPDYKAGTASIANGATTITFAGGANLSAATIAPGDTFKVQNLDAVITAVTDSTHAEIAEPWTGTTLVAAPYRIRYQPDGSKYTAAARDLIDQLGNGNLQAFAALVGAFDYIPIFTGAGALTLVSRAELTRGVSFDVQVNTLADRSAYDAQPKGYKVLVSNNGDGRSALYSKLSNVSADWSQPSYITGPTGQTPDFAVGTTTTLPPGSSATATITGSSEHPSLNLGIPSGRGAVVRGAYNPATAYVLDDQVSYQGSSWIARAETIGNAPPTLPVESNTWWQLVAKKGADGSGTGDMLKFNYDPQNKLADAFPYDSKANAVAALIAGSVNAVRLLGYFVAGDGGGGLYRRVGSAPSHAGKFQSADGAWWELAEKTVTPKMFGAIVDGAADDTVALQAAFDWGNCLIRSGTYVVSSLNVSGSANITGERGAKLLKKTSSVGDVISIIDARGVRLTNFEIDGNAANISDITANGIYAKGFADLVIDRITSNNNKNAGILTVANTDVTNLTRSVISQNRVSFNGGPGIQYNSCKLLDMVDNFGGNNTGIGFGDLVFQQVYATGTGSAPTIQTPFHAKTASYLQVVKITIADGSYVVLVNGTDYTLSNLDNAQGATVTLTATVSSAFQISVRLVAPPVADINNRTILSMEAFQSHSIRIMRNRIVNNYGASIYLQNRPDWTRGQATPNPIYGSEMSPDKPYTYDFVITDNIISDGTIGVIARGWRGVISDNHVQGTSNTGIVPQGKFLTMVGNKAIGCGSAGFDLGVCESLTFTGNTAMDCYHNGIELHGNIDTTVVGNRVTNCCQAPGFNSAGIIVVNSHYYSMHAISKNIVISGNVVGPGGSQYYGIYVENPIHAGYSISNVLITGNECSGSGAISDINTSVGTGVIISSNQTSDGSGSTNRIGGTTIKMGGYGLPTDYGVSIDTTAGTANKLKVASGAAGQPVTIVSEGSDSDIDLKLAAKGGGLVWLAGYATQSDTPITGRMFVKDTSGVVRQLAVIG